MVALLVAALTGVAFAHPTFPTVAQIRITARGEVFLSLRHDALAFALNDTSANVADPPMYELLQSSDADMTLAFTEARERFDRLFALLVDDQKVPVTIVAFPSTEAVRQWQREFPDHRLPVKMDIDAEGHLVPGTHRVQFRFPEVFGEILISVDRPGREPDILPLAAGETSPVFEVSIAAASDQPAGDGSVVRTPEPESSTSTLDVFWRFMVLGFTHILPGGPDHALFVLGLFLLVPKWKTVLLQITAFTVAHTITLTLASLDVVRLPPSVVEPTIAATIAFVGIENLCTAKVQPWRPAVAFLFGLVHGLGVATAFNEAGFPPGRLVPSLAAFTVGVEGGHIAILAAAFLALGWCRDKPWYRSRVAIPLSLGISGVALFWMVQRIAW